MEFAFKPHHRQSALNKRATVSARHAGLVGLLFALCSATLYSANFPLSAPAASRDVVQEVATLIENNYFDATKAQSIANDLREAAQKGRFDAQADPRDLAAKLTARLQPLDHHFRVRWSPPEAPASKGSSAENAGPELSVEALDRRNAYGFRRVEMLPGSIGYIDLRTFADFSFGKPDELARKAMEAALTLVSNADAVIIDLRNNGGGSPAMVGYLVSAFTPPGANIYNEFRHRDGSDSERPNESYPKPRLEVPLYVLISGRTASAAESTAYTLQAAKRATVVGAVSGGAAHPGGEFPVGDGFFVFISTSTVINPITGTNWEGVGVMPDVTVNPEKALERAERLALEAILKNSQSVTNSRPEDIETRWTLEALQAEDSPVKGAPLTDYVGAYAGAEIFAENGHLALRRGNRPPWALVRIHGDVFCVKEEPFRRVLFERDAVGHGVTRLELVRAGGGATWFLKVKASASSP
jgi:Peptidase family S41/N-terminal domain of Peptidase_S41 in eukaryotic IRBP